MDTSKFPTAEELAIPSRDANELALLVKHYFTQGILTKEHAARLLGTLGRSDLQLNEWMRRLDRASCFSDKILAREWMQDRKANLLPPDSSFIEELESLNTELNSRGVGYSAKKLALDYFAAGWLANGNNIGPQSKNGRPGA